MNEGENPMTTDLKAQILEALKTCEPLDQKQDKAVSAAYALMQDPNVFVGRWDTELEGR